MTIIQHDTDKNVSPVAENTNQDWCAGPELFWDEAREQVWRKMFADSPTGCYCEPGEPCLLTDLALAKFQATEDVDPARFRVLLGSVTPHADGRNTRTQPECPPWCEVSPEEHELEARSKIGSWFAHIRQTDVGAVSLMATTCQRFEEQVDGDEATVDKDLIPGFFFDFTSDDALTAAQALEVAQAITRFVKEVEAAK